MPRGIARRRPGSLCFKFIWVSTRKTLTLLLANNKGADQTAYSRTLISAFVIRCLNSKVTKSDTFEFSFWFFLGFKMIKSLATTLNCHSTLNR